jgi:flagellar protein FliO/FliZ
MAQGAGSPAAWSLVDGAYSLAGLLVVFGLLALLVWLLRRGSLTFGGVQRAGIKVEGAVPLGERRSLLVVAVEGRRLLLGVTPAQVSLVTELTAADEFSRSIERRLDADGGIER